MGYEYYPITGIQTGRGTQGQVPVRQEINDWSRKPENAKQVNLFVLALRRLQDLPPKQRESFFQLAGIHGMPYKPWDEPETSDKDAELKGYCTHANVLFPPWHRPYILLYEQRLYEIMINEIIPQYPTSEQPSWRAAADSWRLPFWDWASYGKVPDLCLEAEVTVTMPNGITVNMDNPFYQYKMPDGEPMSSMGISDVKDEDLTLQYGKCTATSRCPEKSQVEPTSQAWINGVVNNHLVEKYMTEHVAVDDKDHGAAAEMLYRLFTYPLDFPHFATVASDDNDKVQNDINLEFIHNNIHLWAGGEEGGHMSQIPVATFDPIFWLHHCNIDRIFAIWQEMNPDKWFTEGSKGVFPQEAIGLPNTVTPKTPLRPFHKNKTGTYWTADEVRNFRDLGYTYPELQPWLSQYNSGGSFNREEYINNLKSVINNKYGLCRQQALEILEGAQSQLTAPAGPGGPATAVAIATATSHGSPVVAIATARSNPGQPQQQQLPSSNSGLPGGLKAIEGGIETNDFAISVRYSKFALGGHPFNIVICLAPANGNRDPKKDIIANVYNFSTPAVVNGEQVCSNCANLEGQNLKATSYVPINYLLNRLVQDKSLASLEGDDVEALLKRLYWRVTKYGREVSPDAMEKIQLEFIVSSNTAKHYKAPATTSNFDGFNPIPALTGGSSGGFDSSSQVGSSTARADAQYLALDRTLKLKTEVPSSGVIVVDSDTVNLTPPQNINDDSTGLSFLSADGDVVLSVSIRRKQDHLRLNSKPVSGGWGWENNFQGLRDIFKKSKTTIMVQDQGDRYQVFVDDTWNRSREKNIKKNITHVEYWILEGRSPALSDALTVRTYKSIRDFRG